MTKSVNPSVYSRNKSLFFLHRLLSISGDSSLLPDLCCRSSVGAASCCRSSLMVETRPRLRRASFGVLPFLVSISLHQFADDVSLSLSSISGNQSVAVTSKTSAAVLCPTLLSNLSCH